MKSSSEPIGRTIVMPASVHADATSLTWPNADPSLADLAEVDRTLQRCDGSVAWWMGDLVCKLIDITRAGKRAATERRCTELRVFATGADKKRGDPSSVSALAEANSLEAAMFDTSDERAGYMRSFAHDYAAARGLEKKTVEDRVLVANFFPPPTRVGKLEWTHHREVVLYAGGQGLAVAEKWLALALAGDGNGNGNDDEDGLR